MIGGLGCVSCTGKYDNISFNLKKTPYVCFQRFLLEQEFWPLSLQGTNLLLHDTGILNCGNPKDCHVSGSFPNRASQARVPLAMIGGTVVATTLLVIFLSL